MQAVGDEGSLMQEHQGSAQAVRVARIVRIVRGDAPGDLGVRVDHAGRATAVVNGPSPPTWWHAAGQRYAWGRSAVRAVS